MILIINTDIDAFATSMRNSKQGRSVTKHFEKWPQTGRKKNTPPLSLLCLFHSLHQPMTRKSGLHTAWASSTAATALLLFSFCHVPLFRDSMDCSLPDSSVYGISQEIILEWDAFYFSMESSQTKNWTHILCIGRWILYEWATFEAPVKCFSLL